MLSFEPSFLDKLANRFGDAETDGETLSLTLDKLKRSVALDLETLLNSRQTMTEDYLRQYPLARNSMLAYGLRDFSALSLASAQDRAAICQALEEAIALHEPRLQEVRTRLRADKLPANRLHFTITAILVVNPAREPVNFDAALEPATFHYSVSHTRRRAA